MREPNSNQKFFHAECRGYSPGMFAPAPDPVAVLPLNASPF